AELVVELALGGVAQHVVGDRDVFETLLGGLVTRVHVRMVLARELAVGLSNLLVARPFRDAEDGVVVFSGGSRVAHSPYSSRTFPEAISRSAVTTSLLSLSTSGRAPFSSDFARRAPSSTSSKRFGTLLRQSSTVMRAISLSPQGARRASARGYP